MSNQLFLAHEIELFRSFSYAKKNLFDRSESKYIFDDSKNIGLPPPWTLFDLTSNLKKKTGAPRKQPFGKNVIKNQKLDFI